MQVYTGIDWSESKHDIVFMNQAGAAIAQLTVPHTLQGFLKLDAARAALGWEHTPKTKDHLPNAPVG